MIASHRNAWRFLTAEAIATAICLCLVALVVGNDRPQWMLPMLWLLPVTAVGSLLCVLQSLLPTPIHWWRTFMAVLLLGFWCFVVRLWYSFAYGAPQGMTKMW